MTAVENRIAQVIKSIHYTAHLLDPTAVGHELDQNQEIDAMEFINHLANSLNIYCIADLTQYRSSKEAVSVENTSDEETDVDRTDETASNEQQTSTSTSRTIEFVPIEPLYYSD